MQKDNQTRPNYCNLCFNARVCPESDDPFEEELTDKNDLGYYSVGDRSNCGKNKRVMIASGGGKSLRIQFDEYFENIHEWHTVAEYYPKFCPGCGRRLDEYEESKDD